MTAPGTTPRRTRPISAGAWSRPINGFRGFAAVVVVVGHTFFATRLFPFTGVIHFISIIVPIFFVVSAYALYRPFMAAHLAREAKPNTRAFWWRRFLRIYPLYFTALTLYLILLPGVRPASGRVIDYLKLYGFMQIYDPDLVRFSGIPAAWFICDEVVFYLMIPGIAALAVWLAPRLARRRRASRASTILRAHSLIAIAMIVIGQVSRTGLLLIDYPGATSLPISNLDYYGFGILLGVGSLREHAGLPLPRPVDWLRRRPGVALAVVAAGALAMNAIANVAGTTAGAWEDIQRYGVYSIMVVPFMVVMALGRQEQGYNRLFGSPRWNFLAIVSLHVYLWHQLVLGGFDRYVTEIALVQIGTPFTTGVILCVGAVVATVAWSSLLRPPLDLPYERWRNAVPRPGDAPPVAAWVRPASLAAVGALLVAGIAVSLTYGGSPIDVHGGVGRIAVADGRPGDRVVVIDADGERVAAADIDDAGTAVVRGLEPGPHQVRQERGDELVVARSADVLAIDDHRDPSFYEGQDLHEGLNQIEMRDGTTLSAVVHLPGPADEGPYPTLVELSGYQIGDLDVTQPASAVARALGYATVGVNVRGTGCSGGAFEMLSDAQVADGYDTVETVAAQPWVDGNTVGLVGFSYGGLAAIEAASSAPPSLNSVVALSTYSEAWNAFHPGGLANSGFPVGWMQDLMADAAPSGTEWVRDRISDGDDSCARNQLLHGQMVDLTTTYLGSVPHDERFDQLSPSAWAAGVEAPIFLSGQLQDATIGSDLAAGFDEFTSSPVKRLVLTNGTHGDAVSPQVISRMDQFLSLYARSELPTPFDKEALLAKTRPDVDPDLVPDGPPVPVTFATDETLDEAQAAYAAAPEVEVLFESGNGGKPGAAAAATSMTFDSWPPETIEDLVLDLAPDGRLGAPSSGAGTVPPATFTTDPSVSGDAYNIEGSDLATNASSGWTQPDPATSTAWISDPLERDTTFAGPIELDLWVKTDRSDVDLQAVLTKVVDGEETLVQVGWRRLSDGAEQVAPETWTQVSIDMGPIADIGRAGTRYRLLVGTPGASQVQWSFYPPPAGAAQVEIGQGGDQPSRLVLPVVADPAPVRSAPGCADLRGQPCRGYQPIDATESTS